MKKTAAYLAILSLTVSSCQKPTIFQDAVAAWPFSGLDDEAGANSKLQEQGAVKFVSLTNDSTGRPAGAIDANAVYLDGRSWLSAEQGSNSELNIAGKGLTLFVSMKADSIGEYSPLLTKTGGDQSIAYSMALHKNEGEVFIETMLGSDDIGGAHPLKYKLPKETWHQWHNILLRFNGAISELYVDGILRDNEITQGEIRDWNRQPLLIGAQYKQPFTPGDSIGNKIESTFKGWIDCAAIWDRAITDDKAAELSGCKELKKDGLPEYYKEKYRPQFHFTAKKNWLNDPNGLVYYDGVYHLFFQYMPPHRHGAYKDWGHAISKDLVHWEQIPQHITPHKVWGGCWSGSAIVDVDNTSHFQQGKEKPIIAFLTNGGSPDDGFGPKCTQCLAYSTDGGKIFTYYDQNPIIKNINGSNRDPKVIWDNEHKKWIMSLYMDKDNDFGLFSSTDLKNWQFLSTISLKGVTECPGFQPLPVDGDSSKMKWLLFGANGHYVVGSFDGKKFSPETKVQAIDYGKNFYAAQTWNNTPDGRCIHIAWMPTKPYPGMPFEQQMNFPTELSLKTTPAGIQAFRVPVREIKHLYDKDIKWQKTLDNHSPNPLQPLDGDLFDLKLEVDLRKSAYLDLKLRGAVIHYDALKQTISCHGSTVEDTVKSQISNLGEAPLRPANGKINLRILVDRTTIEIYGNDGQVVMSSCFMPTEEKSYALTTQAEIYTTAEIHSLKSAWDKQ